MTAHFVRLAALALLAAAASGQSAIRAKLVHTMGPAGTITDGVVIFRDGKIAAVGPAAGTPIPEGMAVLDVAVVTPGLVDSRNVVGLSGIFNQRHDSDQLERSTAIQPELRALDAFNPQERLLGWVRSFGVTTVHTGHAPGELISGQTMIVKTVGKTVEEAVIRPEAMVAATLGPSAHKDDKKSPGTRAKAVAMLRQELIKAQEYQTKLGSADAEKKPERNLRSEALARVLAGELPLLISANRAQDIRSALRLAEEFRFKLVLEGAAESYLLTDEILRAGVPVLLHPSMQRAWGEAENLSFETASKLRAAGVPFAIEAGYEDYVPKTRVVLLEAAIAAANGLTPAQALAAITIDPARILGVADRVGSLEVGKDADAACYDGDPFEYTSHCVAVFINGRRTDNPPR